jgi:transcriptional regulator with XRE-family HTH domain
MCTQLTPTTTTTELLRRLRRSGLSQTEIARRTGIPQPRLSRWERGPTPAGADDALKLAALHATVFGAAEAAHAG